MEQGLRYYDAEDFCSKVAADDRFVGRTEWVHGAHRDIPERSVAQACLCTLAESRALLWVGVDRCEHARQPGITALSARNGRSSILGVLAASPEIAFAQEVLVSGGLHGVRRPEYRL